MPPPETETARWFRAEIQPHDAQLRAYLRGSFPAVRDLDDVVQESYLRVWRARASRPVDSARAFLYTVARHLAFDWLRRERAALFAEPPAAGLWSVPDERSGVIETVCAREDLALLAAALLALPPRCREVMMLRQVEGLPQREIARRLGISELTVQTHVVNGLRRLEARLRPGSVGKGRP